MITERYRLQNLQNHHKQTKQFTCKSALRIRIYVYMLLIVYNSEFSEIKIYLGKLLTH